MAGKMIFYTYTLCENKAIARDAAVEAAELELDIAELKATSGC